MFNLHVNVQAYERLAEAAADVNVTIQNRLFPSELPIKGLTSENFFVSYELVVESMPLGIPRAMLYGFCLY